MASYFVIESTEGNNWKKNTDMRKQDKWSEHADFMNGLEAEGFVVLGGPIYRVQNPPQEHNHTALLIIDAKDEETVRKRLDADPWLKNQLLKINWIKKWDILLNRDSPVR